MSNEKNLYEILGVKTNATKDEIKSAFRKLVRIYHPDVNQTIEAEAYFKLLNNAVETLLDDIKRHQYDILLGKIPIKPDQSRNEQFENKSFKNEPFEPKRSATPPPQEHSDEPPIDGKDIETSVSITRGEAIKGATRKINILHTEKCAKCLGKPFINGAKCTICNGLGEKSIHKKINVKIPSNVKNGKKIRVANMGEKGLFGGKDGDLFLIISITEEKRPQNGNAKDVEVIIFPHEAALGAVVQVPLTVGFVNLKIPPLTKSGQRFKLVDEHKGEFIVTAKIDIPSNLTNSEIELYKKLKELDNRQFRKPFA